MKSTSTHARVLRLTQIAMFAALIVVLQVLSTVIPMPYVRITLTLIPVVLGGVYFGKGAATFLGAIFGAVVTAFTVTGADVGAFMMFQARPVMTVFICFAKAMLAGFVSAWIYGILKNKCSEKLSIILAATSAPIVNTSFFCVFLFTFYPEILQAWAGGTNVWLYMLTGLVGINFVVELLLNIILCPVIGTKVKLK